VTVKVVVETEVGGVIKDVSVCCKVVVQSTVDPGAVTSTTVISAANVVVYVRVVAVKLTVVVDIEVATDVWVQRDADTVETEITIDPVEVTVEVPS
jgi:hypothetical protein